MGEIINKISFNGMSYDISIPHGTVIALQDGTMVSTVSSLPSIGQMIALTFESRLSAPTIYFTTNDNEISLPMTINYRGSITTPSMIATNATYLFIITQQPNNYDYLILSLIGDLDSGLSSHASTAATYGVGTTNMYGHVKTITGDVSTITSHTNGYAAAAYHSHSIYKKTYYLSSVTSSEETTTDDNGLTIGNILIRVNDELSHDLENGDVLIFPLTTQLGSFRPGAGYHTLSNGLTITTPSGERRFSFSDEARIRFTMGLVEYNIICVVEKNNYLRLLNPVDYMTTWEAYTATTAGYANYANYANTATTATQANKLSTARYIDGLSFNGASNVNHYGVCTVVGTTAIKKVTITGLTAITGAIARVKFTNAHTVTTTTTSTRARLVLNNTSFSTSNNVGVIRNLSTGFYLPSTKSWASGQIVEMIYDGTYWNIISPYIQSNGSVSGSGGTSS